MVNDEDFLGDRLITLREVANYLPRRRGRKVHYSTVFRWVTKGARGRVLRSILVGGVRFTSVEALEQFLNTPSAASPRDFSSDDSAAIEQALNEAGI
jgi:hypothetical protein